MKKIVAISLLFLILWNMLGYYLVYFIHQVRIDLELTKRIEKGEVAEDEFFIVKVPVLLYHQVDKVHFEEVTGNFEHEGKFYRMVKQKLENDTIFVYCLNDLKKQRLFEEFCDFNASQLNGLKKQLPVSGEKVIFYFFKDYFQRTDYYSFCRTYFEIAQVFVPYVTDQYFFTLQQFTPPPEIKIQSISVC